MTEKKMTRKEKSILNKKNHAQAQRKATEELKEIENNTISKFTIEIEEILKNIDKISIYNEDLADVIIKLLKSGMSLKKICSIDGMPSKTVVYSWIYENEDFSDKYTRARQAQIDIEFEELQNIAEEKPREIVDAQANLVYDKSDLAWRQQRIDVRKWRLSKLRPDKYGDRIHQQIDGTIRTQTIVLTEDEINDAKSKIEDDF